MLKIYSPSTSSRLQYTCRLIFNQLLGIEFALTNNLEEYKNHRGPQINYSDVSVCPGEILVIPFGLLNEKGLRVFFPELSWQNEIPLMFPAQNVSDLEFDVFSAVFYMVSRYEEYLPFKADRHGRFSSDSGVAGRYGFVEKPVVNLWVEILEAKLISKFPDLEFHKPEFSAILTVDIDNAYAIKHKGIIRGLGSMYKSLAEFEFSDFAYKCMVHSRLVPDPFDTYHFIHKHVKEAHLHLIMFFLVGSRSKFDKNLDPGNIYFKRLIEKESKIYSVGIHPSYSSNGSHEKLSKEVNILRKIIKRKIKKTRQHYLKLSFPNTYQNLIKEGIEEDYTMGFHDMPGFRAGIANPFYFYDLSLEKETNLKIVPFQVMDATLNHYQKLNPEHAIEKINQIMATVKKVNGTFVAVWHNESLSNWREWKGWLPVFEHLTDKMKKRNGN